MSALDDIAAERRRQVESEGWTEEHDDRSNGQMAAAAACYALNSVKYLEAAPAVKSFWPWSSAWWKPKNQRHDLIRAAALLVAEIERIDRETPGNGLDSREQAAVWL